jgi:O-antigen ligase
MTSPQPQIHNPAFKTPAVFILCLLVTQTIILLASIELPIEVFIALLGLVGFYYLLKNTFAGLCAFILLHILVLRSTEGINAGEIFFGLYFFAFLGVWFFRKIFLKRERILLSYIDYALAGFLAMSVFSFIPAYLYGSDLFKWFRELIPVLTLLFIFPLRDEVNSTRRVKILIASFLLLSVVIAVNSILNYKELVLQATETWQLASSRQHFIEPQLMAIVIVSGSFFILAEKARQRWFAFLIMMTFSLTMVVTFTRSIWIGTIIGFAILFLFIPVKSKIRMVTYFVLFVFISIAIMVLFFGDLATFIFDQLARRFLTIGEVGKDLSFLNRIVEAKALIANIEMNPIVGYGLGKSYSFDPIIPGPKTTWYAHNTVLFVWFKIGLVGLISLIIFAGGSFFQAVRLYKSLTDTFSKTLLIGCAASLCAIYVVSFTALQFFSKDSSLLGMLIFGLIQAYWLRWNDSNKAYVSGRD